MVVNCIYKWQLQTISISSHPPIQNNGKIINTINFSLFLKCIKSIIK